MDKFPTNNQEIPLYTNPAETKCCSETCVNRLSQIISGEKFDILKDKGLLEYSTISGAGTFICNFLDFAEANNITADDIADTIDTVLDKGIVISCNDNAHIIASVETYLMYAESAGEFN